METIKITKADLNENNEYKKGNIGKWNEYENVNVEIDANLGWVKFTGLYIKGYILAKAGSGIEAGWGIEAGSGIKCKLSLSFSYKLFAGTSPWTNSANKTVTCGKLLKGTVAYGDLIETGMPEEEKIPDATTEAIELLKKNGYEIIKK